jgi:hypothetical protein
VHNIPGFIYAASQTINADTDGPIQRSEYYNSCLIVLDITELGASQTLQLQLMVADPVADGVDGSAATLKIDATPAFSSTGTYICAVGLQEVPLSGQITAANAMTVNLPLYWLLNYNVTNSNNATFSIGIIPIRNQS